MAVAPDGSLYVGSGNEGKVFKVDGAGKTDDVLRYDRARSARARSGARTAPSMRPPRLTDASTKSIAAGKSAPFFDPEDKYIWSLALDQTGNLYAGTGEKGLIYKITPDGKGSAFYQTKATHVISLAFERTGQLLAGTEGPGRLFRIDAAGKAFLLLDSTFQEIRAIRIDPQGNIYLAALSGRTSASNQPACDACRRYRPVGRHASPYRQSRPK